MTCFPLDPSEAHTKMQSGARLIDIRGTDEFAREHIPGATNVPLDRIDELGASPSPIIFYCRSGMRTEANAARLAAATGNAPAYILAGGIDAWREAGQPTVLDEKQPIEIMRQVQIAAGTLILIGVLLGFLWSPALFGLSAFVGAGLVVAGATGWCGMAEMLRALPWNRRSSV